MTELAAKALPEVSFEIPRARFDSPLTSPAFQAAAFAAAQRARLRYVAAWKRWMEWDGTRWRADDTLLAADLAGGACRRASVGVRKAFEPRLAARAGQRLGGAATPAAVERLARADRHVSARPEQFDADQDLLNTPSGIVDTRTGETQPHRPDACMTRITAVAPADPDTPCPIWCRFVDRITGGDAALAFYLQRLAGYALTGQTVEHALFLAHGPGANGKSVFMATLARILGDYADVASLDALAAPSGAEIARLAGARLVTAEDLGEGRAFPLARLKALAAGGKVAARLGRNQTVAVTPRFKLLIAGNERPSLDRFDEATRRRLHLVPFAVTIPEDERDPFLLEKLAPELPAILRWAIDGAVAWRKLGLAPPEAVRDARARHVAAEDSLGQWLDDCAEVAQGNWESASALYASWCAWAAAAGEDAGSQKRFSQLLEGRGFTPKRRRTGHRGFLGLWLGAPMPEDADNPSSAFAREANEGCRAEARKGEGGLVHDEQRRDTSPVIASQPSPTEGGRGCERSERVRAGAVLHADAPRLPEAPSHALTLPSPRGPFGKSSGGPLPLPPSAGEGLVRKTRHHASSVRALSACP